MWVRDDARLHRDAESRLRWHGVISDISEQKRAEAELERRAAQQAAVARLGERALERVDTADLIEQACSAATELLDVELASVAELSPDRKTLRLLGGAGWPPGPLEASPRTPIRPPTAATRSLSGAPVVIADWEMEGRFTESPALKFGARSGISVPIEGRCSRLASLPCTVARQALRP